MLLVQGRSRKEQGAYLLSDRIDEVLKPTAFTLIAKRPIDFKPSFFPKIFLLLCAFSLIISQILTFCDFLAASNGFEPLKCQDQNLVPYHLATGQWFQVPESNRLCQVYESREIPTFHLRSLTGNFGGCAEITRL